MVRLSESLNHILAKHDYPTAVARLVGEAAALTVLLATSLKIEGQFQLLTRSDGAVSMLVVDFDAPDRLRALARFDTNRVGALRPTADIIGAGHLAVTLDQGNEMSRYQGIVALQGQGLQAAAQEYFDQSVQIPTRVRLASAQSVTSAGTRWRAGGLLMQHLPRSPKRIVRPAPDDGPRIAAAPVEATWEEAEARCATVEDHELVDPRLSSERLLYRLFHELGVRVFRRQPIRAACRCSDERIRDMLSRFTPRQREEMTGEDGMIGVTCEFCLAHRVFDPKDFEI